jgi:hypothetical protein
MIEFLKEKQEQFIQAMDKSHLKWLKEQHEPVLRQMLYRWHMTSDFKRLKLDERITEPVHEIEVGVNRFGVVLRVKYQFLEEPEEKYIRRALKRLNNLLSERDYGYLQESNYLSAFTGEKRTYIARIGIQNDNLFLIIDVGSPSEGSHKVFG